MYVARRKFPVDFVALKESFPQTLKESPADFADERGTV